MAESKTKPTGASVDAFLEAVPDPERRADAVKLREMMERLSRERPYMYGPTIVGFGSYRYQYESGREGEAPRIGFSPRAKEQVLYLSDNYPRHQALMDRLGKHRTGKSCLYIRRLSDVDGEVLEQLIVESLAYMRQKYPEAA
ncbi:MAG TPA: DUF1801 domain-containing protein [Allosphingosinicella sp.]|jgi:hypothetical protein